MRYWEILFSLAQLWVQISPQGMVKLVCVCVYSLHAGSRDAVQHTHVQCTQVRSSQSVQLVSAESVSIHTQILTDQQLDLRETHTSAHWSTVHSLTHTLTLSLSLTHTHSTISASQSPLRWFIRDESVSIFVTFHFLTSSGVAAREAEPKTCSTPSDSPPGYTWEAGHTHVSMATLWLTAGTAVFKSVFYLVEFVQDNPLVAPFVNSIGHGLQVVLQCLDAQTGVKLRHVVRKRKHVTVHLSLQDLSHSACCFYRRRERHTNTASNISYMLI